MQKYKKREGYTNITNGVVAKEKLVKNGFEKDESKVSVKEKRSLILG
ncbi:MAG: hypothetical protein PHH37_05715 [Paludibacter sp.]|nr:hypothetical protein [Paludibacter sp.]